ncbi:MAG TPA: phosphoglucomutase/phosphomannomutase family protein, partial [Bacillota bacterium]
MADAIRFGTDGWRAIIAEAFTFANVARVAQAVADWWRVDAGARGRVIVGYDTRFLSPRFAEEAAAVLAGNGFEVLLVDRPTPTPAVSWAIREHGLDGGLMITASHNPPEYHGIKVKAAFGGSALPEMTEAVERHYRRLVAQGGEPRRLDPAAARRSGRIVPFDARPGYFAQLRRYVDLERLRGLGAPIVVDTMHGAGYGYLSALLREQGLEVIEVRAEPRPDFGGGAPEPIARNLRPARAAVIVHGAAAGLCVDGDADRVAAIDEEGAVIDAQRVFALLLSHLYRARGQRGSVVKTFAGSRMIDRLAERFGLPFRETPVGFKHVCRWA